MKLLLNFVDEFTMMQLATILPTVFIVLIIVIIIAVVKRAKSEQRQKEINGSQKQYTDGNGRTAQQSDYLLQLRARQAEQRIKLRDAEHQARMELSDSHAHSGSAEHYEPIVGSLGEVTDEGCGELDGVRLVEHDEAYCDDVEHLDVADYFELQRAIVFGEVVNNPRFKTPPARR